jgi:hypothetical protein
VPRVRSDDRTCSRKRKTGRSAGDDDLPERAPLFHADRQPAALRVGRAITRRRDITKTSLRGAPEAATPRGACRRAVERGVVAHPAASTSQPASKIRHRSKYRPLGTAIPPPLVNILYSLFIGGPSPLRSPLRTPTLSNAAAKNPFPPLAPVETPTSPKPGLSLFQDPALACQSQFGERVHETDLAASSHSARKFLTERKISTHIRAPRLINLFCFPQSCPTMIRRIGTVAQKRCSLAPSKWTNASPSRCCAGPQLPMKTSPERPSSGQNGFH